MRRSALGFAFLSLAFVSLADAQSSSQSAPPRQTAMGSAYGEKLRLAGIANAGKINERLYRGAQPRNGSVQELKRLGVTTIVDLRGEDSVTREREKKEAESLGIHFVNIPVSGWSPPTNDQVAQFLSIFRDKSQERVFVHCRFGEDRTGVFVATYRMAIQHWPSQQALNEMYSFGFNGFWHRSMISFVRDFPARLTSAPALVPFGKPDDSKVALPGINSPN